MPLAIAGHIVSEVARALAYAHAFGDRGIVHRDVTPDNVMLSFSGDVKLVDFGIARSNVDATLTGAGHVVGRPTYTAPEVWDGAQADRRADIYSLGVVLWQLLTARRFEGVRPRGTRPAPAPSAYNGEVPPALDAVVARALSPDPAQRHQTADELHEALRACAPAGFVPRPALAELLARHFDVARERRMLAAEVEHAQRFLVGECRADKAAPARAAQTPTPTPARAVTARRTRLVAALGATSLCALAVAAGLRRPVPAPIVPVQARQAAAVPHAATAAGHPAAAPRTPKLAPPPSPVHPIATSAGRARPPGAKTARPAPSPPSDELLRRAQDKFDVGETEAALALARQAAAAGARGPAHILMGKVLMSEQRLADAEREFAEAVRLDPDDARAARLLALVRETRSSAP
jgi:serine/threonine-protein kinase